MIRRREFLKAGAAMAVGALTTNGAALAESTEQRPSLDARLEPVKALTFDVFGTVVDWRSSIIREGELLGQRKGLKVDWPRFADQWVAGYGPAMQRVRKGDLPWTKIDDLFRLILGDLIKEFRLTGLTPEEVDGLNRVWHRLRPWPDAIAGLSRLRRRYIICTLSNANVAMLVNMAKNAGLPWDCVLSAELSKHYKPDKEVYLTAADLLGLEPSQVMMVAAHPDDLRAAAKVGFRTAVVLRPLERGPGRGLHHEPNTAAFDLLADDFLDLARRLGA